VKLSNRLNPVTPPTCHTNSKLPARIETALERLSAVLPRQSLTNPQLCTPGASAGMCGGIRAQYNPADPDFPGLRHRRPDHPERLNRDRAIRIDVIWVAEIHRVDVGARHKGFEVDDFRAFHVERLELGGREGDEPAALVFVAPGDLLPLDLLAGVGVVRAQGDASGAGGSDRVSSKSSLKERVAGWDGRSSSSSSSTGAPRPAFGCHTWCRRIDFVRVDAGER
jgi:hypothetical protein